MPPPPPPPPRILYIFNASDHFTYPEEKFDAIGFVLLLRVFDVVSLCLGDVCCFNFLFVLVFETVQADLKLPV